MRIRTWLAMGFGAAVGAGLTYLLDPEQGRQRRRETAALTRQKLQDFDLDQRADFYAGQVKGSFIEAVRSVRPGERSYDPKTLIRKVESEVLGHADIPVGEIVVDADANGIVTLRGQLGNQRRIDELVAATREVEGVEDVHNLLHMPSEPTPGTPAAAEASGDGSA